MTDCCDPCSPEPEYGEQVEADYADDATYASTDEAIVAYDYIEASMDPEYVEPVVAEEVYVEPIVAEPVYAEPAGAVGEAASGGGDVYTGTMTIGGGIELPAAAAGDVYGGTMMVGGGSPSEMANELFGPPEGFIDPATRLPGIGIDASGETTVSGGWTAGPPASGASADPAGAAIEAGRRDGALWVTPTRSELELPDATGFGVRYASDDDYHDDHPDGLGNGLIS